LNIEVKDDAVVLEVISSAIEPLFDRGRTVQTRYKGQVEFEFPAGYLTSVSAAELKQMFGSVLSEIQY
jgi:hypothetical protein